MLSEKYEPASVGLNEITSFDEPIEIFPDFLYHIKVILTVLNFLLLS